MTPTEAHDRIRSAMDTLTTLRDEVGEQLASMPNLDDPDVQRLSILHDRVALMIAAYYKGA